MSNNGKFLSSMYRDEIITLIIEEAINGQFQLTFIDRDTGIEQILSRGDLSAIRRNGPDKNVEIQVERATFKYVRGSEWLPPRQYIDNFARNQNVGYSDLWANESNLKLIAVLFGVGDKFKKQITQGYQIRAIDKDERQKLIKEKKGSVEARGEFITSRAREVYEELYEKYPRSKFIRDDVAAMICDEEKDIYERLGLDAPIAGTYLKFVVAPKSRKSKVCTGK